MVERILRKKEEISQQPLPRWFKIAIVWLFVGACVSITFMIIGGIATYQNYQRAQAAHVQPTALPTQQPTQPMQPTQRPTMEPTQSTSLAATHGQPRLGGPVSDFVGKYGQPQLLDNTSMNFFVDKDHNIVVSVSVQGEKVIHINVQGLDSWTAQKDTWPFCSAFEAEGATSRGGPDNSKLYDSPQGRFSIMIVGGSGCTINFAEN